MTFLFSTIAFQFDLVGNALGILLAVVVSFVAITLISSYYRFLGIVKLAEDTQPEEMGSTAIEVLRIQLARYLAGCARRGSSFSVSLIHVGDAPVEVHMDSPFINAVKKAARSEDITCVLDAKTVVLFTEAEPEDSEKILSRITGVVAGHFPELSCEQMRVGIASYPGHGLSGKDLLQVAQDGLARADAETPIVMPEIIDVDAEDEEDEIGPDETVAEETAEPEEEGVSGGWKERRKNAMLDELTGVLKPSAISAYMQRQMSEYRRTKVPAALFCIGVNNMDHIVRIHGEQAAADILVGISKVLQENLRANDLIGRHEKTAFLVLAQASPEEAEIMGKRISTLVQQGEFASGIKKLKTTITLGVASFPEHGRNLHQLYVAGQKVLDYSRANDIRAYAVYDPEIHDKVPSKPMRSMKSAVPVKR